MPRVRRILLNRRHDARMVWKAAMNICRLGCLGRSMLRPYKG